MACLFGLLGGLKGALACCCIPPASASFITGLLFCLCQISLSPTLVRTTGTAFGVQLEMEDNLSIPGSLT